jgi:glycosyltransferase involved in cell wall biosynthesis
VRIAFLNWRDVRSPRAGGAERVTYEIATRLARRGYDVTCLSSVGEGLPASEVVGGVKIVRRGTEQTTRLHAPIFVRRLRPDVVVEEINTLPYFAPVWSDVPVLLFMHQLAREVWWYEAPRFARPLGWLAEPLYLRAYCACEAATVSASTRDDLRRLGLRRRITVIPLAVDVPRAASLGPKRLAGDLVAVGRLAPSKRFDHAIHALAELHRVRPSATLTIIGDGRSRTELADLAARLGISRAVRFRGRVGDGEKVAALDAADLLVGTSAREGWGLTVTEAAARGTPAVVYDVPGFRDSVVDGRTGRVVAPTPAALARVIASILARPEAYERLRTRAWEATAGLSFNATAAAFENAILSAVSASNGDSSRRSRAGVRGA